MSGRTRRNPDANFRALRLMVEAEARRKASPRPGAVYSSPEELVLEAGRRWTFRPLSRDLSPGVTRWGIPRGCFSNAMLGAMLHRDLRYVEGFAYAGQVPVHHAWNVDPRNVVLDFTWREDQLHPRQGRAYLGVVVSIEAAWEAVWHRERTVLDCPPNYPELMTPWTVDNHPARPTDEHIVAMLDGAGGPVFARLAKARLAS